MTATILIITAATTALMAGLFFAYACSVNIGLGRLSDTHYLKAMQSINRAIINPYFMVCFLGTVILLPLSTWLVYSQPVKIGFYLWLFACIFYIVGVFGVTMLGNVPLNETLDKFNLNNATTVEIARQRKNFETKWNKYNLVRTIAAILAFILVASACINYQA